jgi:hypothetical protein
MRCGKSEEVHRIQKNQLSCHYLPSKYFGANACWWFCMVMSFNLITLFSTFAGAPRATQHLKKIRHTLINIPGVIIHHAHNFIIRLDSQATAAYRCLTEMRYQIVFTVTGLPPPG